MKVNKFRLIVNGSMNGMNQVVLILTKKNYAKIISNISLVDAVREILQMMEEKETKMILVPKCYGYDTIQIDKLS